jgi:membrane protease YdiL (CAAX protease family)
MTSPRLRPAPWNELHTLAGLWGALIAYLLPLALITPVAGLLGANGAFRDAGDAFERAATVVTYADHALARAAAGNPLPTPPRLLADPVAVRIAWLMALVSSALFIAVALAAPRRPIPAIARAVGLDRFDADRLWLPALCVAILYPLTGVFAAIVTRLGLPILAPSPDPATLSPILRDPAALALYGVATVVAAPLSEEAVYRGLAFTGTLRWGFLPAAFFSSLLFALSHRDLGTFVPSLAAGMTMAWLYYRSGCLWDAVAFHVLFNGLSLILLLARY